MTINSDSNAQELELDIYDRKSNTHVSLTREGNVSAQIDLLGTDREASAMITIITTATDCSWNVYASAKLSNSMQPSNRTPLVEIAKQGQIARIGNTVFLQESESNKFLPVKLNASKFSLYVDSVKRHGDYLFLSSRQHITTVPEPEEESKGDVETESKDEKGPDAAENDKSIVTQSSSKSDENSEEKTLSTVDPESSDDDDNDPANDLPKSDSEDESEENSADESWSEGSTEFDSDTRIADVIPRRPPLRRPAPQTDSSTSDDSDLDPSGDSSEESDVDADNLVEGRDKGGRGYSWEEDNDLIQAIYVTDRVDPMSDEEEDNENDAGLYDGYEPDDLWDDYDYQGDYRNIESDSGCSECGDDGGVCALPPKESTTSKSDNEEEAETPIGAPLSEVLVYKISEVNNKTDPERIFHFKRPTSQILYASEPAIHPTKPLFVWPLGDGKVLFADYINNTFFVRRIFTNQFWSSHVSVNCRFSSDGKYLHLVTVEKYGQPPELPVKKSKATKAKKDDSEPSKKKDPTTYELVVSTYRMSSCKTTKAPPKLVGRINQELGELKALPAIKWDVFGCVFITAPQKEVCHVYRVDISSFAPTESTKPAPRRNKTMNVQSLTVTAPEWAQNRGIAYLPDDTNRTEARLLVAAETERVPWYRPDKTAAPEDGSSQEKSTIEKTVSADTVSIINGVSEQVATNDANVADTKLPTEPEIEIKNQNNDIKSKNTAESRSRSTSTPETKKESIYPHAMVATLSIGHTPGDLLWSDVDEIRNNAVGQSVGTDLLFEPWVRGAGRVVLS